MGIEKKPGDVLFGHRLKVLIDLRQAASLLDVHPLTLTTEKNISDDQLTLYSMFVRILDNPDAYRSYPAIKTLIESEFSK